MVEQRLINLVWFRCVSILFCLSIAIFVLAVSPGEAVAQSAESTAMMATGVHVSRIRPGAERATDQIPDRIEPTFTDVAYGPDPSNLLDFYQAPSDKPTPVIVHIHGGGFIEGSKDGFRRHARDILRCFDSGVSVASINYRFVESAPLQDIIRDSARAVQFVRFHAGDWNIDKTRVAAFGDSAGAGMSLWLAFHDDLADPDNADPVLRESTRLAAAGGLEPQATYDFVQWPGILEIPEFIWTACKWYVSPVYYNLSTRGVYGKAGREIRSDLDMLRMIDDRDCPIYLSPKKDSLVLGLDILHNPAHVRALEKKCRERNLACQVVDQRTPKEQRVSVIEFLLERLCS